MKKYVRYCDDLLIAGLLLFYYEDARSFRRYLIALVDAMTHNPHNLSASLQNGNVSFAVERDLQINEEIADFFFQSAFPAERNNLLPPIAATTAETRSGLHPAVQPKGPLPV